MKIAAIQKLTLLDYPGKTACIVFLPGCDFRCHACHNPEMVMPEKIQEYSSAFIPEDVFFRFLTSREGLLDGVCVSGGEPTIHAELPEFLKKIKDLRFFVKLDTNGNNPKMLEEILNNHLVDFVAMDVKASSAEKYFEFSGVKVNFGNIEQSKNLLLASGIPHEFRTTFVREFHDAPEYKKILDFLKGVDIYILQNFRTEGGCLDKSWEAYSGLSEKELLQRKVLAEQYVKKCEIRA